MWADAFTFVVLLGVGAAIGFGGLYLWNKVTDKDV